jgi:hypothetical protein
MLTAAAVVVCALDLLGRSSGSIAPIRFLDVPPPGASRNVEAFVMHDPDTIYLITSTETFRAARRAVGDPGRREACRHMAGVIVHEEWHLRNGTAEQGAYLAQLTMMMALGADAESLSAVRRSMMFVADREKKRRRAEFTIASR